MELPTHGTAISLATISPWIYCVILVMQIQYTVDIWRHRFTKELLKHTQQLTRKGEAWDVCFSS